MSTKKLLHRLYTSCMTKPKMGPHRSLSDISQLQIFWNQGQAVQLSSLNEIMESQ